MGIEDVSRWLREVVADAEQIARSAFAVEDRNTGALRLLNYKESKGRGPSYVSMDGSGRFLLDANYGGGFVEIYSLAADGSLDRQTAFVQHEGSSVHPQRQTKPYAHWIRTDPSNKFALVADLGTDHIMVYRFDAKTGALSPNDPPSFKVAAGSGPRHLAFHPNHQWLYAVQELSNEVLAFKWDAAKGVLTQFQAVKTLPEGFAEPSTAAEIAVRSDGRFVSSLKAACRRPFIVHVSDEIMRGGTAEIGSCGDRP